MEPCERGAVLDLWRLRCALGDHEYSFGCRQSGNANGSTSLNTGVCAGARNTFRRAISVLAAAATLVGAVPWNAPAEAAPVGDGSAIAEALDLPLGHQIASNWNQSQESENGRYGEFWRARLAAGDQLIIDWALTASACSRANHGILVYTPSVNDKTVARASPVADHDMKGASNREFVWVAPSAGHWTLFFYGCRQTTSTVAAWVQQFTQMRVTAPSHVAHGHSFKVTGTVSGASGGTVAVAVSGPGAIKQLPVVASIAAGGNFATRIRLPQVGVYTLRIAYYGDSNHRPSQAVAKIHVG